jgi:hypothetical protein
VSCEISTFPQSSTVGFTIAELWCKAGVRGEYRNDYGGSSVPYCVSGDEFKPMAALSDGRLVCCQCGHLAIQRQELRMCLP